MKIGEETNQLQEHAVAAARSWYLGVVRDLSIAKPVGNCKTGLHHDVTSATTFCAVLRL